MRVLASADEIGNVKEIVCARGTDTSQKDGQQPELVQNMLPSGELTTVKTRIARLALFDDRWILAARLGGQLSVYDYNTEDHELLHSYTLDVEQGDKPIALVNFEEHDFAMVAFESATVFAVYFNNGAFDVAPLRLALPPRQTKDDSSISAFQKNPYVPGIFAYGGNKNDLQIVRLFKKDKTFSAADFAHEWKVKVVFQAENVEPDHLGLDVPIWITNILFCRDAPKSGYSLVTATRYGHVRKYNTKEDSEPTELYKVCDNAIVTLTFASEAQDEIIITDTHTFVARLSLTEIHKKAQRIVSASAGTFFRPSLKLLGKYSEGGNTGAIHAVDVLDGVVAFAGLDRYLRVFDVASRKLLAKVYLGTQTASLVLTNGGDGAKRDAEEDEDFWNELEAPAQIQKKKRKI